MQKDYIEHTIESATKISNKYPFNLLVIYLVIEFIRPQSFIPGLSLIRPGLILLLFMFFFIFTHLYQFNFKDRQTKLFIWLLLLMAIHVPIAVNNFHAFNTFQSMLYLFVVYVMIANAINDLEIFDRFYKTLLIIFGIVGIVGLMNGGKVRYSAILGDPNDFALLMNMAFVLSFFMSYNKKGSAKLFYLGLCCIFLMGVIASQSRGGFVGFIPAGLYCFSRVKSKIQAIVILVLIGVIFYNFAPDTYWEEMRTIKEENIEKGTGAQRWYYWQCGWRMFLDNPVIGVGQGNYPWRVVEYEPNPPLQGRYHGGAVAHSIYFTLLPELGLIGTLIYGMMMIKTFGSLRNIRKFVSKMDESDSFKKYYDSISLSMMGAFVAFLASGAFLSVLYYPHFWVLMAIPFALEKAIKSKPAST